MNTFKHTFLVSSFLVLIAGPCFLPASHAQSVDLGADLMSRYVWRGTDFGESPSIQPALSFSAGGFSVGSWGSYAMNPQSSGANEHDLWASYSVETAGGTVELGVTDYYFPNGGVGFFNFEDGGTGAHQVETFVSYAGPEGAPFTLYGSIFAYNEPDHSIYLEASYPFTVEGVDLSVAIGGTPSESTFYGTDTAGIINTSLTATRSIPLTDTFSLPVQVSYVLNPYMEKTFFIFGISL